MYVILSGEPLKEVDCFKYLGSQVATVEGCDRDVVHGMNEGVQSVGSAGECAEQQRTGIKTKKCLYGVIVPTALYGEAWGMGYEKC